MRESFLGCPLDILSMRETVDLARGAMRSRRRLQHVALNVAKLVNMRRDPILAADVASSDVVSVDGMGIVWAARFMGLPVKVRVTGIDLFYEILSLCAVEGYRPYFLGATPEVLEQAARRTRERRPSIQFAGLQHGYFSASEEKEVVDQIRRSRADCLFIAMPTPRKERFLASHRDELDVPFIMGVGGSFDVLAGKTRRAPARMQRLGLEWLYRVYQEPRRMWWRYARTNALFAGIVASAIVDRALRVLAGERDGMPPGATRLGG